MGEIYSSILDKDVTIVHKTLTDPYLRTGGCHTWRRQAVEHCGPWWWRIAAARRGIGNEGPHDATSLAAALSSALTAAQRPTPTKQTVHFSNVCMFFVG